MFWTLQTKKWNRGVCHHYRVMAPFFVVLFSLIAGRNWAAPYTPSSNDQVLARLSPAEQALQQSSPMKNLANATAQARQLIDEARLREDSRFLGYAQATLKPFLTPTNSAATQLLMAEIEQYQHHFSLARSRLNRLLEQRPDEGQAWLMLANLDRVQGHFTSSRQACQQAATSLPATSVILCLSGIQAMTGNLDKAEQTLTRLANSDQLSMTDDERQWLYTLLTEIAVQQGKNALALTHVQQALQIAPQSPYLRYLQSDIWLMQGANAKVIADLLDWQDRDNALLRLAIAAKRSQHSEASNWRNAYQQRIDMAQQSQRPIHHREHARFLLSVTEQADEALEAARANWETQRELSDLRILLASAALSKNEKSLDDASRFIQRHNINDAPSQHWNERATR